MEIKASVKKKEKNKKIIPNQMHKPKDEILHTMLQDEVLFVFNQNEIKKQKDFEVMRLV